MTISCSLLEDFSSDAGWHLSAGVEIDDGELRLEGTGAANGLAVSPEYDVEALQPGHALRFEGTEPPGYTHTFAVSFDDGKWWSIFRGGSWQDLLLGGDLAEASFEEALETAIALYGHPVAELERVWRWLPATHGIRLAVRLSRSSGADTGALESIEWCHGAEELRLSDEVPEGEPDEVPEGLVPDFPIRLRTEQAVEVARMESGDSSAQTLASRARRTGEFHWNGKREAERDDIVEFILAHVETPFSLERLGFVGVFVPPIERRRVGPDAWRLRCSVEERLVEPEEPS